ncbi:MAG: hypothetical protein MH204_02500, partial [Fimbriimonadaceae bacterium]|nr:hypothetical protein [Fimbriimonadaceae bacterium]
HVDTFLFDLKATGEAEHRRLTGVDPRTILASLRHLVDSGADVILRCPLVPGVNDTDSHLRQIAGYSHLVRQVDLMPYHTLGECKYGELGLTPPMQGRQAATEQDEARWLQRLAEFEAERVGLG